MECEEKDNDIEIIPQNKQQLFLFLKDKNRYFLCVDQRQDPLEIFRTCLLSSFGSRSTLFE